MQTATATLRLLEQIHQAPDDGVVGALDAAGVATSESAMGQAVSGFMQMREHMLDRAQQLRTKATAGRSTISLRWRRPRPARAGPKVESKA